MHTNITTIARNVRASESGDGFTVEVEVDLDTDRLSGSAVADVRIRREGGKYFSAGEFAGQWMGRDLIDLITNQEREDISAAERAIERAACAACQAFDAGDVAAVASHAISKSASGFWAR